MKVYIIFESTNITELEDEIIEIYTDKKRANERFVELTLNNNSEHHFYEVVDYEVID